MLSIRLLDSEDPAQPLADAVRAIGDAKQNQHVFEANPDSFRQIPNAPFSYWVSNKIRKGFSELPAIEGENRHISLGLSTKYDFRFVRLHWEPPATDVGRQVEWANYANGGSFSPFYSDVSGLVNAMDDFRELRAYVVQKFPYLKGNAGWILHDENDYLSECIAWPLRTHRFSPACLPAETVFSARTYVALLPKSELRWSTGVMASTIVDFLLKLSLGRSGHPEFVTSTVRILPWPTPSRDVAETLESLTMTAWSAKRNVDTRNITSHAFVAPQLGTAADSIARSLVDWSAVLSEADAAVSKCQIEVDEISYGLYEISRSDREAIEQMGGETASEEPDHDDDEEEEHLGADPVVLVSELIDYLCGTTLGRWDIRYATGERQPPELPDPFDALPVCPPGMLQNADGLPAAQSDVPDDYPLPITWPGILVSDPGHPEDIVARVRDALAVIWGDRSAAIEQEACEILGVRTLRDYFAEKKSGGKFFKDHLKRYSKSRRQAPLYWPLSTESGSYTLWIYYHRLDDQILYKAIREFVEPKQEWLSGEIATLRKRLDDNESPSTRDRDRVEELEKLERELKDFKAELEHWAPRWKPNLNDGVQITAAPLWKLFRLKPWQKKLKETWEKLEAGDYDWAHLAHTLWPARVREKCKTDKSLAIAHNLESLYVEPEPKPKMKKTKK